MICEAIYKWRYCVIGNIVKERVDEDGNIRHGCLEFPGGRKVYLCGKGLDINENIKTIDVIGLNRFRHYEVAYIPVEYIENVRFSKVYKKTPLCIMDDFEFCWYWWDNSPEDGKNAWLFAKRWNEVFKRK